MPAKGKKVGQFAVCGIAAFFSFALSCMVIRAVLPRQIIPDLSRKLDWLTTHQADYDTLFIGSSHVFMQINPKTFDTEMARRGTPTHSYNLGLGGMGALERDYVIDTVARRCPHLHLRLAVIELEPSFVKFPEAFRHSIREEHWHDFRRTTELCGEIVAYMVDRIKNAKTNGWNQAMELLPDLGDHSTLFLRRFANVGEMTLRLQPPPKEKTKPKVLRETEMDERGFAPIDRVIPDAEYATFRKNYEQRGRDLAGFPPLDPGTEHMLAVIRGMGAAPCFFISPNSQGTHPALLENAAENQVLVVRYDDREKYPQFYEQDHRSDDLHLNKVADEDFSRMLASDVTASIKLPATTPKSP